MQKEFLVIRVCDFITKYSIYALVFLVPIFFLPQTTDVLDFNKQTLLLMLVFVSLFALMLKILISGKLEINKNPMNIVAGVLFLAYLLATIFSTYRYGSFWGQPQQTSESMLTIVCLLLFYFLVSNVFSRKDILTSVIILSFSAIVVELIGVLQLFSLFIIPFDFAKSSTFNLIGSTGSLGIFTAIILPLSTILLITVKKWWRVFFALQIILSALILFLIDYPIVWWVVIAGSIIILTSGIIKRDFFDGRWMALPMFFFAVSLFFVFFNPQINWLPPKTNEIFLSQRTGLDIAIQAIKERPLFGSGPGTFAYDFLKFKNPDFSKSSLWNITFNKSSSEVLNNLSTTGVLGFLAMLGFMAFPIFYGIKFLFIKKETDATEDSEKSESQIYSVLLLGLIVVLVEQGAAYFIYNSNIVLDFVCFFTIAALAGLIFENPPLHKATEGQGKKEYTLKSSYLLTITAVFVSMMVFVFGIGLLILNSQRYLAEENYYKGLVAYQSGQKTAGLKKLESAANLNPASDLYFRQLSQVYLLELQDELQSTNPVNDQDKTKIQNFAANSMNAAKIATDLNPQDVDNWSSRGYIYQNLIGISGDASKWAIDSYDSALKLDPNDPYLFFQEGSVYLTDAVNLSSDNASKNQLLLKAQSQLEKAVALNPSYSNALYSLGMIYSYLGQKDKAIDTFTKLQYLNPTNTDVIKILSSLKTGK